MTPDIEDLKRQKLELELAKLQHEVDDWERGNAKDAAEEAAHRIYDFTGDVTESRVRYAIQGIGEMVREDPHQRVTLRINSPGGSVMDGLALVDFIRVIRAAGTPVDTVALGMAASMGGVLLQAGERRYMTPNCFLLIHEVSSGAIGKVSELKDEAAFSQVLWNRLVDILAERSTMTARQIRSRASRRDWWIGAEDAVKLGFADEVLPC